MNELNPTLHTSNQVSLSSPRKQNTSPKDLKDKQIKELGVKSLKSLESSIDDIDSLVDRDINQEPFDDDLSFLQDIISNTEEKISIGDEFEETKQSIANAKDENSELIQEYAPMLENAQEVETQETLNVVNASMQNEVLKKQEGASKKQEIVFNNAETVAKRAETSLGEIHALTNLMMKDKAKVIENTTITVRHKNLSVLKFVKDATPQELRNAKPEDFGLVVGDRHLRHPNFKFKPGDVSVLHINGQPVQLRMEHMRQDQADKFQTIYKEHITQVLGNQPVNEKKDDQKLVKDGSFASHLQPKDLRLKLAPEKKQMVSGAPAGPSQSELDKHAEEAADLLKARKEKDEIASARREKAELKEREHKEIQNEKSTDNDTTLTMQAPGSRQRKSDALPEPTKKKNKELKN